MTGKEKLIELMEKMYKLVHEEAPEIINQISKEENECISNGYFCVLAGFKVNINDHDKCLETIEWVKNKQ